MNEIVDEAISRFVLFTNIILWRNGTTNKAYDSLSSEKNGVLTSDVEAALKQIVEKPIENHEFKGKKDDEKTKELIETINKNTLEYSISMPIIQILFVFHTKERIPDDSDHIFDSTLIFNYMANVSAQSTENVKSAYPAIENTKMIMVPLLHQVKMYSHFEAFEKYCIQDLFEEEARETINYSKKFKQAIINTLGEGVLSENELNLYMNVNPELKKIINELDKKYPVNPVNLVNLVKLLTELEKQYPGLINFIQIVVKPADLTPQIINNDYKDIAELAEDITPKNIKQMTSKDIETASKTLVQSIDEAEYLKYLKKNPLGFFIIFVFFYSITSYKNLASVSTS